MSKQKYREKILKQFARDSIFKGKKQSFTIRKIFHRIERM